MFFLISGALVALAIFLWATNCTIGELESGEPAETAHYLPLIAAAAVIAYYTIGQALVS